MTASKRTRRTGAGARINADHIGLYWLIVAGILATAAAAIITSWNGLIFVADWQGLPMEWRWVTPVMIDVAIIVFTLGSLAKKSRGESLALFVLGAYGLTAISSASNFLHTVHLRGGMTSFEDWTGAFLNALAPALILLTTEVLGALVTRPKRQPRRRKTVKRATRKPATVSPIHAVVEEEGVSA